MDITFTAAPLKNEAAELLTFYCDRAQLLLTLREASQQAIQIDQPVLASFTQPVKQSAPLPIFLAFQSLMLGDCFFWDRPSEQRTLIGLGATTTIETTGPDCVAQAASIWRDLQQHAVIKKADGLTPTHTDGPVLFGGFTFDPLNLHTTLWQGFPDGLLILPRLLFHCDENSAALTINTLIQPTTDIEQVVEEICKIIYNTSTLLKEQAPTLLDTPQKMVTHDLLPPQEWKTLVAHAIQMIEQGTLEKVVLARGVQVFGTEHPFNIALTLQYLCKSYPDAYIFAIQRGPRFFVGATPERLVCGIDGQIQTMALAGSAPRGITEEEDQRLGTELLQSLKNQGEHHFVVTTIQNALASLCSRVWVADTPHLLKLKNIQHLQTPLVGDLLPGRSILEAVEYLHPTPAVGGTPHQPALAAIRNNERMDRGWYAAPIGWIGTSGNGEFAVALRSALVEGNQATLFAGCGIVAASNPDSELAESHLKLQVMLHGLGAEE